MKEHNLSRKSLYSVFYLLCGLFMFFFMFAILNLSSYAASDSCLIVKTGNGGSSGGSTTVTVSNTISINYTISSPNAVTHFTSYLYVTTTEGTYLLRSAAYSKASGNFTDNMGLSGSFSVTLPGDFVNAYVTAEADDNLYVGGSVVYDPVVFLHSANDFISYRLLPSSISDVIKNYGYTNLTPLKFSVPAVFNTNFFLGNDGFYNIGDDCNIFYDNFNSTNLAVGQAFAPFRPSAGKVLYLFSLKDGDSISNFAFYFRDNASAPIQSFTFNQFSKFGNFAYNGVLYNLYALSVDLPVLDRYDSLIFAMAGTASSVQPIFYQGAFYYNSSIADYMATIQSQWDTVNPSVVDTNANTAQTVSDINTVNTFENTTFENFDTLSDSVGLDSFSLTSETHVASAMNFLSTCIVTVYNGFPSDLKWLIQCIGIFGIFALLLSVFGRVGKRINNE